MSEWETLTLSDAGVQLIDCDHKTPEARTVGKPYVGIPQIKDGRIDLAGARLISEEDFIQWTRKAKPQPDDVVLSRRCNPGETAYVPSGLDFALGQNLVLLRANGGMVLPKFLRWLVRSPAWWEQIQQFLNVGAVFDSLKCREIPEFELPIPPQNEQENIAEILSSLDEKIELNRKQNLTLEAIAQTLFKRWFVEFEFPDENGRPYKSSGGAMQPSELGEIPVGWEVAKVGDAVEILGGGTPRTSEEEYWTEGQIDWYSPTDLTRSGALFSFGSAKKITGQGLANSSAKLFPEYSLMMTSRATIGVISINSKTACTNQGFITLLPNDEFPLFLLHGWLLQQLPEVHAKASGSTFKEISRGTFKGFDILKSPEAAKYQELVYPIYSKIESNLKESKQLAAIRDTLLPKLMSGELRVA